MCEEATLGSRRLWGCYVSPYGWAKIVRLWEQASSAPFIYTKGVIRVSLWVLCRFGMQKSAVDVDFSTPYEPPGPICARPNNL